MNVLELLNKELNDRKNYSLEEKMRYIYIRSCEIFSYDSKINFLTGLEEEEIRNKKIDLENVVDNEVVCSNYTDYVLSILYNKLLNIETISKGSGHRWLEVNNIKADATKSNDLARVKMNLNTIGYINLDKNDIDFKEMDKKINYINNDYHKTEIINKANEFNNIYPCDELLLEKIYVIRQFFNTYNKFKSFSDAEFAINYLSRKILNPLESYRVKCANLYQINDNIWSYINIYNINLFDDNVYFILLKDNNDYYFYEITYSDFKNYLNSYEGYKDLVLKRYY